MPTEADVLEEIFPTVKWKGKYTVSWCHLCGSATIKCPDCKNIACSCDGCAKCMEDYEEWSKLQRHVHHYLTPEEHTAYIKGLRLQELIVESIRRGEKTLDWNLLQSMGELSRYDLRLFKKEIESNGPPAAT